ncbi:glycoside hydrolase family 13/glycosyltransferase family 5 protein [Sistotremastrum suecicum HHB10207 ss-3]|uniref:alpha-1,3-glucan synthase n=1 Tax=Sistotremastrum suecicum HHB10207 ss-3 TaxID=1314776 RepID=A0A166GUZ5_9AGAM|nr:glycoside hydrolase family 13/glycosyltransferase family 5 protein [Sistotremastrum suecicum HHB10207 ss-3]
MFWSLFSVLIPWLLLAHALPYNDTLTNWNLNTNQGATDPLQYTTSRKNTTYTPSPENWRELPIYSLLLDKFADGDPANNDFFSIIFENDWRETGLRYGGDVKGLQNKLDYIQGMGTKTIFIAGTVFVNMPWQADSYSPVDFSTLDPHWGVLADWVFLIDEIHSRGMYIILDFTVGTMADMIAFDGFVNSSAPFDLNEYNTIWKDPDYAPWGINQYADFNISNAHNASCVLPTMWQDDGTIIAVESTNGCYASEFDQYGDMEAFGVHPDYERQLSKFASVQDRLREWQPAVRSKIEVFSCLAITALDIDGIRVDKATQVTLDALSDWATATRACAFNLGKKNFLIAGEVTGGDTFGALYYGRGRTPTQRPPGFLQAANVTANMSQYFLRDAPRNGLDAVAFHYSIYRALTRFLGMDGNLQVAYDIDVNFVTAWNEMFVSNDFLNAATGLVDPRHMYGTSNFDVFRWPSLVNGTQKSAIASFITSLVMPGIPLIYYGEEQNFYLYDNTANNYLFGRQPMSESFAWQKHGCYKLGSQQYFNMPLQSSLLGCHDDWNSLDHFDPTTDTRRLMKRFNDLRATYASLQDGFNLVQWGNWTDFIQLPGSNGTETEIGLWTVTRAPIPGVQDFTNRQNPDQVWMLYTNENVSKTYTFPCDQDLWISSPYMSGTVVRNLFYPYENYTLQDSKSSYYSNGTQPWRGCLPSISLDPLAFKALIPATEWVAPTPALSRFVPGHDARIIRESNDPNATTIFVSLEFTQQMDCTSVTNGLTLNMASSGNSTNPTVDQNSINCGPVNNPPPQQISGSAPSAWAWSANLINVPDGVLELVVNNIATPGGAATTGVVDHLLIRKGSQHNIMVNNGADYDNSAFGYANGNYTFTHKALGADMLRYTWNYGQNWSDWRAWEDVTQIPPATFVGTEMFWEGQHIMVQYWSKLAASSTHVVHADLNYPSQRRVPQFLVRGRFNTWGFDKGIPSQMTKNTQGNWELEIMDVWPSSIQLNVFGFDNYFYGDVDGDGIMERLPPNSVSPNYLNLTVPPSPHLAWALIVNDSTLQWSLEPRGDSAVGAIMFALLATIPMITAVLAVLIFRWSFYGIKFNQWGMKPSKESHYFPIMGGTGGSGGKGGEKAGAPMSEKIFGHKAHTGDIIGWPEDVNKRRKVLIATLEYEILDWKCKVKIGGLGVMSTLMGKAMTDVDLVWVVPKVKDIEYPAGDPAEPIEVIIFNEPYLIEVETHVLDNITYVILDSPVFRAQTKADPYPARMDDLSSAIFYSTWNQAIAATIRRYPVIDIYHINDYHGALAPIYLLPKVIPVCLSLHNAEFQGLWPLRTKEEMKEVCSAFNISKEHCTKYVQFGNTFNLLHAAASFISVHQKSVGVAGVSDKYGKRSWARYPALWTLKHVDSLPNPDPSDIAALDEQPVSVKDIKIDNAAEAERPEHKRQAQEWAGIKQDPNSDLFVFVGRWSKQKGVDLIADIMPSLLIKRPTVQLICVGPVIDLYGRFAAEKLARLMEMYPDRVFSKPEFTALPPYLFSGADFALIPSRDEPFGLVAVEFGRKGALGVGSRLGGLGLMPGWWFPVESNSTGHMLSQLSRTIKLALKSSQEERAMLRARSAVQRFPVVEWRHRTEDFHRRSIQTSRNIAEGNAWRASDCDGGGPRLAIPGLETEDWDPEHQPDPSAPDWDAQSVQDGQSIRGPHSPGSPGQWSADTLAPGGNDYLSAPNVGRRRGSFSTDVSDNEELSNNSRTSIDTRDETQDYGNFLSRVNRQVARDQRHAPDPFMDGAALPPNKPFGVHSRVSSVESIASIVDEKQNSPLNKAIASFTDADGHVVQDFVSKLQALSADNSKGELSIEKYLTKSEEVFFEQVRKDKISSASSIRSSHRDSMWGTPAPSIYSRPTSPSEHTFADASGQAFDTQGYAGPLPNNPGDVVMTRLQIAMQREVAGWPLYTIVIALGQMLGATSFQITLLSGQNWENNLQLYVLGGVFLVASIVWYTLFRLKPSVYVLSSPWLFFALAFFLIGLPSVTEALAHVHDLLTNLATWSYAVASAAAFIYFGLNFGEEAGAATEVWSMRACIVQGSQQIWVAALWYWGNSLNGSVAAATPPWWIVLIVWPLAALCLVFAYVLQFGLPEYYRQVPPKVPNFIKTLFRRKIVVWFLASEILRDYWLSGPYGRNWSFLWSAPIPKWATLILIIVFFIGIWAIILFILTYLSKTHTWFIPVFAVGLGAPRWCQMLWGTSSLALYIPWAGRGGPYLGTTLWLWLGVLDAVQGVGLGMILLQTLSRLHVCATLAFSQVIGCICVMVARATAPNSIGPGSVFPDAAKWDFSSGLKGSPMASAPFWVAMISQIVVVGEYLFSLRSGSI